MTENLLLWVVALAKITIVTNLLESFDNQVVCLDRPPKWGTASVAGFKGIGNEVTEELALLDQVSIFRDLG